MTTNRRRRTWAGRLVLLLIGTFVLPPLVLEAVLRGAHCFVGERRQGEHGGESRVLCLGDSHTYGVYFAKELSYPSRLQAYLDARLGPNRVGVVPAGQPGASLAQMRAALPELLVRHAPDVVVVLGGINDRWNRADRGAVSSFLSRHLRLWTVVLMFAAPEDDVHFGDDDERVGPAMAPVRFEGETLDRSIREELAAIARIARAGGATPLFLTYASPDPEFATPDGAIRRAAEENGVELVDLARRFAALLASRSADELLIPGDGHPRPPGYDLMARAVARQLLPRFGGTSEELPEIPLPEAPRHLRLALDPARAGRLVLEGPARRRFHVYVSRSSRGPGTKLRRVMLPISADDPIFLLAAQLPFLRGALDDQGRVAIELDVGKLAGAQLGTEGLLAVATLLRADAPADPDDRLWAEEISNLVTVVGPDGRPPK